MKPTLGVELCEALGLDPMTVHSLTVNFAVGEIATATAGIYVDRDGRPELILADYRLTWAPPTGQRVDDPFGFAS